jgi:two-component system, cell cycle response regulator DivK
MALIIVIEDNEMNSRLAARLLRKAGHEVLIAEEAESGLTMTLERHPDLVLIDMGLPDMDGQTVAAVLRQQDSFSQLPLIAFTAWPEDTAYEMARAYGLDGVISKPIDTRAFAGQVNAFLQGSGEKL